jgi:polysaccharide export outer membrane protein
VTPPLTSAGITGTSSGDRSVQPTPREAEHDIAPARREVPVDATSPATQHVARRSDGERRIALAAPEQSVPAAPNPPPDGAAPPYAIGIGDVLAVSVWKNDDFSADAVVRPDGRISLPLIGDVQVAGRTTDETREVVRAALGKVIADPVVSVRVTAINSRNVFVIGQVIRPGMYALTERMTILQALAAAGGLTKWGRPHAIMVTREIAGKPIRLPFDYDEVIAGRRLEQNVLLAPGDTVVVP